VISIDESTLAGASEVVDIPDVQSIVCSSAGLHDDLLLVGFRERIEARCV